jgi:hypothetical protein
MEMTKELKAKIVRRIKRGIKHCKLPHRCVFDVAVSKKGKDVIQRTLTDTKVPYFTMKKSEKVCGGTYRIKGKNVVTFKITKVGAVTFPKPKTPKNVEIEKTEHSGH